ncbi:MAG: TIGR03663 family protein [Chloroflexi bacterium AL-W]|nr:TIGR03663 family protein [Chloroflexi bacterium AL-N1]NOK66203.1 TIGR03663 family protein [Chloroflexi bacterium AL-N10]NOK73084.1 TIGR03663 family protein [Chloroflexi bacterium AL-N5]NOK79981.1 TIGR03663 family protein [Chloroflexi bacterium AL-W]NOK88163.1 TIGR03663 family protein [Chloroflexi bacterium AL-N15]
MSVIPRESREFGPPTLFDRTLDFSRVSIDVLLMVGIVLVSIVTHLWGLGHMALHHDESIHAWMSWKLYTGEGGFTCAGGRSHSSYCYDPVYHGPSLYLLTFLSYFLFGDGDAQARIPQAVAGILMVASVWWLRPYLGRYGTIIAAVLLALAPSLLYFTRFARHDGLMVLWTVWMVIGFFRYLDTGRACYLYLLAIGTALAMGTHELYYILFYIFGSFVIIRALGEWVRRRFLIIGMSILFGIATIVEIWNPQIGDTLDAQGIAILISAVVGSGLLMMRVWDREPILLPRLRALVQEERTTLFIALGILASLFIVMYSVFFTDPRGVIDGLYQGLAYWLGSQHEFARGDQPWYYYLMLLPIYEPLALFGSIAAIIYLFTWGLWKWPIRWTSQKIEEQLVSRTSEQHETILETPESAKETSNLAEEVGDTPATAKGESSTVLSESGSWVEVTDLSATAKAAIPSLPLFPLFLAFWFIGSLVVFSWAGEKMPWLLVHISLPGNLLIAWGLGKLFESVRWRTLNAQVWLVPPVLFLTIVAISMGLWRISFGGAATTQETLANVLQGLLPLLIGGVLIFSLLTIAQLVGIRATIAISTVTVAFLCGLYMLRASWMVVYENPDTPVEPLVYVQTSPDVPRIVEDLRILAINQTRNDRTAADPIGGNSMPVIIDGSDEGSLNWPFLWYLRDFERYESRSDDFFTNITPESFLVPVSADQPDGEKEHAPAVLISSRSLTEPVRQALEQNYVYRYGSTLNWWFPEGNKCDPQSDGYKRFYYSRMTIEEAREDCSNPGLEAEQFGGLLAPILWPFDRSHWPDTAAYLMWRELPDPLQLNGREMEVWVRRDLAPTGDLAGGGAPSGAYKLISQQIIGSSGQADGELNEPRDVALDSQGNVYVADTFNHRINIFASDGSFVRAIGSLGRGEGQFNEPRGIAIDGDDNIYVADTWNARVVKLDADGEFVTAWGEGREELGAGQRATITDRTQSGNAADPFGFFGPRDVAVDDEGNVYVADTGNRRIVVTNDEGEFIYQWGYDGSETGAFNEPTSVDVDDEGNVYVADVWNGRVQVFPPGGDGLVSAIPSTTFNVNGWEVNSYDDPFVAAGENGQIFVSVPSRNLVMYTDEFGEPLLSWGGVGDDFASFSLPSGLAVAEDGSVYVIDRGNDRVMQFQLPVDGSATPPTEGEPPS